MKREASLDCISHNFLNICRKMERWDEVNEYAKPI